MTVSPGTKPLKVIGDFTPSAADPLTCLWHGGLIRPGEGVVVGWIGTGPSAGRDITACPTCVVYYGIVPFVDHPDDTDGTPRYERGQARPRPSKSPLPGKATCS